MALLRGIFRYSGLEFIYRKFIPSRSNVFPNGIFWLIGIYVGLFSVASQNYENKLDRIEHRTNALLSFLVKDELRKVAINQIPEIQNMDSPHKPKFHNPIETLNSMFGKSHGHTATIDFLKKRIEDFKLHLKGTNLQEAKLAGSSLHDAKMANVNLVKADLSGVRLQRADLEGANLNGAKLKEADVTEALLMETNLREADLQGAYLWRADLWLSNLKDANLQGARIIGAINLTIEQLSQVKTLYEAHLETHLEKQIKTKYPHLLEKPIH